MTKKTIAFIQGDPGGIGPELLVRLLSDEAVRQSAKLVIIGAPEILARGEAQMDRVIEGVRHAPIDAPIDIADGEILHLDLDIDGISRCACGRGFWRGRNVVYRRSAPLV